MRPYPLLTILFLTCLYILPGCEKDNDDPNKPVMNLSIDNVTGKSGKEIELTVDMTIPDGFKELLITKGVNLAPDNAYGVKSVTPVAGTDKQYRYEFSYKLSPDEVDKLVGFNFKLTDNAGRTVEKDLTVNTTAGPAQIIFTRKWLLKSKFHESGSPAVETIENCEKDNVFTYNRDSTINLNYGALACGLDGLNVYDTWYLSEDEKTFTQIYHALFNPSSITTEKYNVRSITREKLVLDIVLDLSWLGAPYTDKEVFVYTFEAQP